jgi:tetratricopeptide (TPR) repeat protein
MTDPIRQKLGDIVQLLNNNRFDDAESMCREGLDEKPNEVNLLGILGAILIRKGELDDAEKQLSRAIELEPGFAKPHEDLGALHLTRNDADVAIPFFEKALAIDSSQPTAMRGLVAALQHMGREQEAEALHAKAVNASSTAMLHVEADELRKKGDTEKAIQICDVILGREPENTHALRILAIVATEDERFVIAEGYLRRIVKLLPGDAGALSDLGKFLGDRGRYPEAIEQLRPAATLSPQDPDIQLYLGNMFGIVGWTEDALRSYNACLEYRQDDPAALIGKGHMLRIVGRQDEANACYTRCAEVSPDIGSTWWYLASLSRYSASDVEVAEMQAQLASDTLTPDSEVAFRFAVARAFEKREHYEAAWEQYALGNAQKRALVKYDPVKSEMNQGKIQEIFSPELLSTSVAKTPADITPIFIVGMPRSGSTLIEQILASHSNVGGNGELPYVLMLTASMIANKPGRLHYTEIIDQLDAEELTGLGRSYLHYASTHSIQEQPYFTDKMPANYPHVGFIHQILPHAKIIDARRDPMATCVANYRQLFAQGKNQSYDLTELGEYYLQYLGMMAHWDEVLPGQVLRVQYENVVADLESEVRRILDFCGLPFEEGCVEFHKSDRPVNTASSEQVREPIYTSGVDFWKNYDPYLDELREVLAPVL